KPRPSASSGTLNAMRDAPVSMSDPTIDSSNPNTIIAMAFSTEPFASTVAKIRPSTISEKYSAGPNASASLVKGARSTALSTVAERGAIRRSRRWIEEHATPKARARLWESSTTAASPHQETREQLHRQRQRVWEEQAAADRQATSDDDGFLPPCCRGTQRRDH